jgi:uncharacterized peroxidase-related enzyme
VTDLPISRFPVPNVADLPEDLRDMMLAVQEKTGFIPNVFLAMAHRPDELRAFVAMHDILMEKESGLSKADREMIVVATSSANDCLYCVVAHGAILRIRERDPVIADRVATNYRKAGLDNRRRAMVEFAVKVATDSASLTEGDFTELHEFGFSDEDIWDIGAVAALFAYSNRMANLTSMQPNPEFYTMGREPRI